MEFSGQYLTYQEYHDLGGTLQEDPSFNLLEFEARRIIDVRTFNRLKDSTNIPNEVKLCVFDLINSLDSFSKSINGTASNGNIASENIDGYSVSYVTSNQIKEIVESRNKELGNIVSTYLLGVVYNGEHLMYCGVK